MEVETQSMTLLDRAEKPVESPRILEPLLTVKEVSDILKLSPEAVRMEIKRGKLIAARIGIKGGVFRVRVSWLTDYVENRKTVQ